MFIGIAIDVDIVVRGVSNRVGTIASVIRVVLIGVMG